MLSVDLSIICFPRLNFFSNFVSKNYLGLFWNQAAIRVSIETKRNCINMIWHPFEFYLSECLCEFINLTNTIFYILFIINYIICLSENSDSKNPMRYCLAGSVRLFWETQTSKKSKYVDTMLVFKVFPKVIFEYRNMSTVRKLVWNVLDVT